MQSQPGCKLFVAGLDYSIRSDELRQQFLAPTVAGDFVACLGVSEVGAGSDVAAIATTAVADGDELVINGK